jgi:hypothetical protein
MRTIIPLDLSGTHDPSVYSLSLFVVVNPPPLCYPLPSSIQGCLTVSTVVWQIHLRTVRVVPVRSREASLDYKDDVPYVWLCGKFTIQPHVRSPCGPVCHP